MRNARQGRLYRELRTALSRTSSFDLARWSANSAARLPIIAARRVANLAGLFSAVGKLSGEECSAAVRAAGVGQIGAYPEGRTVSAIGGTVGLAESTRYTIATLGKALFNDPKKNAPDIFALAFGVLAGSGGLDADGGISDSDLALGIGWHRSLFTHSILAGTVVEGAVLALADFADVVCAQLPESERDPYWAQLLMFKDRIAGTFIEGAGAGIAYHLAVDSTIQPAPHHGLLVPMPTDIHQTLMGINAIAEGLDAGNKEETAGQKVVGGIRPAGGVVTSGATVTATTIRARYRGLLPNEVRQKTYTHE